MALSDEVMAAITRMVRGGFWDDGQIVVAMTEEMYRPGELDPDEVEAAVATAIATNEIDKAAWPEVTDNDRLQKAFDALRGGGVIALENAGFDQSDGYREFREVLATEQNSQSVVGYCFYHQQDLETAIDGNGLYLAFGPRDPQDEVNQGPVIGRMVVEELTMAGLPATWNGDFRQRIHIAKFDWRRR